jgi:hypothetical protein
MASKKTRQRVLQWKRRRGRRRRGQASVDYVLILGVILPMVAFIILRGREIMRLVYEFLCVMVAWPFL